MHLANRNYILCLFFFCSFMALPMLVGAEDKGEEAEEPAAESSEDKQSNKQVESSTDYLQKNNQMISLRNKIETAERDFSHVVRQKDAAATKEEKQALMKQMEALHKERAKMVTEYNTVRDELLYKYPQQGALVERKFAPAEERSMEALEKQSMLGAKLTAAKRSADRKYHRFNKEQSSTEEGSSIVNSPKPNFKPMSEEIVDEKPIEKKKLRLGK